MEEKNTVKALNQIFRLVKAAYKAKSSEALNRAFVLLGGAKLSAELANDLDTILVKVDKYLCWERAGFSELTDELKGAISSEGFQAYVNNVIKKKFPKVSV
jgi:hypothetical protein